MPTAGSAGGVSQGVESRRDEVYAMRLYVTGGTGFVGSNILKVAIERYQAEIFTTVHSWHAEVDVPFTYGQVDMLDRNRVFETVRRFAPEAIDIIRNYDIIENS
jgi:nucleoside-diphosphate-sugar epimerase